MVEEKFGTPQLVHSHSTVDKWATSYMTDRIPWQDAWYQVSQFSQNSPLCFQETFFVTVTTGPFWRLPTPWARV